MARGKPLTDTLIRNLKPEGRPYKISDSKGLFLLVMPSGGKLWRLAYRFGGKQKTIALGTYPYVSLAEARQLREQAKADLAHGIDPSLRKKAHREALANTFGAIALEWYVRMRGSWAKGHAEKVKSRLDRWLLPWLKDIPITQVTAPLVLECARRAESQGKIETAHRIIQLAGQIIRYAIATGRAQSDPTLSLRRALPPAPERHFPAPTTPEALAEVARAIWEYKGSLVVRGALQVLLYTFVRPGELRNARWGQFDLERREWRFVTSKTRTEHLVPLARQVIEILEELRPLTGASPYVFESMTRSGRPISQMTLNRALQSMGFSTREEITSHGFRATARTLIVERLGFNPEAAELQLGHAVRDRLGTAYNRIKLLDSRWQMMQAWADYVDRLRLGEEARVVPLRRP